MSTLNSQVARSLVAPAWVTGALKDRSDALQTLGAREEEFRLSFESASVGKAHIDIESMRIIRCNAAFAKMLGYQVEELIGRQAWELTFSEDLVSDQIEFDRLLKGEIPVYIREKRYLHRTGRTVWARSSGVVVPMRDRSLGMIVMVIEDIDNSTRRAWLWKRALPR